MYEIHLELSEYNENNWNREWGFVYVWKNLINNKRYLGSHKGSPWDGYIGSGKNFKKAIKKYGLSNFRRNIIYIGIKYKTVEDAFLKILDLKNNKLYYNLKNCADGGDTSSGTKRSKEVCDAISARMIGTKHSEERRKNNSLAQTGLKRSEEHRKNISKAMKLREVKSETRIKISESKKGKKRDPETIRKISEKRRGVSLNLSEEQRRRMSEAFSGTNNPNFGKPLSSEVRNKISNALKGKSHVKVICPHCSKEGGYAIMKRYHFDKCKFKL